MKNMYILLVGEQGCGKTMMQKNLQEYLASKGYKAENDIMSSDIMKYVSNKNPKFDHIIKISK